MEALLATWLLEITLILFLTFSDNGSEIWVLVLKLVHVQRNSPLQLCADLSERQLLFEHLIFGFKFLVTFASSLLVSFVFKSREDLIRFDFVPVEQQIVLFRHCPASSNNMVISRDTLEQMRSEVLGGNHQF